MRKSKVVRFREESGGSSLATTEPPDWFHVLYKWVFVLSGIDPFLIYKTKDKRVLTGPSGKPLMGAESLDNWREFCRYANMLIFTAIGVHTNAISVLRISSAVWAKRKLQELVENQLQEPPGWREMDEWFKQMSTNMGDPFTRSTRLGALIYYSSLFGMKCAVILPAVMKRIHYDSSADRFLAKPQVEMQQIGEHIRRQLGYIGMSFVEIYNQISSENPDRKRILMTSCPPTERRAIRRLESQYRVIRECQIDDRLLKKLYPRHFTAERHKKMIDFCKFIFPPAIYLLVQLNMTFVVFATLIACGDNLYEHPLTVLRRLNLDLVSSALNSRQKAVLIEVIVSFASVSTWIGFIILAIVYQSYEHLKWIDDASEMLNILLSRLRRRNPSTIDNNVDKRTDFELLKAIVHLNIFDKLACRSTRMQGILVTILTMLLIDCVGITVMSRHYLQPDPNLDVQLPLIGYAWLNINLILLWISSMPSREITMKKIVWSILADQTRIRDQIGDYKRCEDDDPLVDCWRRLVLADEFIHHQHPVCAFGIAVTFNRVLRANFMIVSLVTWLKLT